jgi:photosystem II stability/assembly factor-like uncharacterized protein
MDKFNSSTLYATISDKQIIKSVDGGKTWQNIFNASGPVIKLSIDIANNSLIYSLISGGSIMKSTDGGKTFASISNNISGVETIEADPMDPGTVYIGGRGGLYKSEDAGTNWKEIRILNDPKAFPIKAIAINPSNNSEIMYGASQAVYKSIDGGQSWSSFQLETKKAINIIRYDTTETNTVFVGLRSK